jgi:hypothetical protein
MKRILTVTAISVAIMLAALPFASAQDKAAPPAQAGEKIFQGQLDKVDANAKSIMVRDANNKEMTFEYTDATQIAGEEKSVQGLAGKTGTELRITYRDSGSKHIATKIETVDSGRK